MKIHGFPIDIGVYRTPRTAVVSKLTPSYTQAKIIHYLIIQITY